MIVLTLPSRSFAALDYGKQSVREIRNITERNQIIMNNRKIIKGYKTSKSSSFNEESSFDTFKNGIIYTLYSDEFNLLKVGFAENDKVLEKKLSSKALILLDIKKGSKKDLFLLITTLKELGIKYSGNLYFKYSSSLMRHLSTLGWPIGRSLYKQRKIKKELLCA